jgi:hypothetical protein
MPWMLMKESEKILVGSDLLAVVKINTKGVAAHGVADTWKKRHVFEDMAKQMGDSIMRKSVTEKGPVSRRKDA